MRTYNLDPNFSIVMRGGCNAKCQFCFNKNKVGKEAVTTQQYASRLEHTLDRLPKHFYQIAITGNEPMLSPDIDAVLSLLANKYKHEQFSNILLTSNGTRLMDKFSAVKDAVHHINISRHHYDEKENLKIFGGAYKLGDYELEQIIDRYSAYGVDVSLNCVISNSTPYDFIMRYVEFANRIGAFAVRFRKENGDDLTETPAEYTVDMEYPVIKKWACPVCRTWMRVIKGLDTYWKASTLEPVEVVKPDDRVYEFVFDTNAKLYLDWGRKYEYDIDANPIEDPLKELEELQTRLAWLELENQEH